MSNTKTQSTHTRKPSKNLTNSFLFFLPPASQPEQDVFHFNGMNIVHCMCNAKRRHTKHRPMCYVMFVMCLAFEALKLKWRAKNNKNGLKFFSFLFVAVVALNGKTVRGAARTLCYVESRKSAQSRPSSTSGLTLLHIFKTVCWPCIHLANVTSLDSFLLPHTSGKNYHSA